MFPNVASVVNGFCLLMTAADVVHANLGLRDNSSNPCGPNVTCSMSGQISTFHWRPISAPSTFTAFTIVTIINTVSDTTTTSTIIAEPPEDYAPPPTNSEGKRIGTVTYDANGITKTTTIVYPTLFFDWDTQYAVTGGFPVTHANGESECINLGTSSTIVPISGDPQPDWPRNMDPADITDPHADVLGWGYTLEFNGGYGLGITSEMLDLLPEHPGLPHSAIKSCSRTLAFPMWPEFDASWMATGATSVTYVGDEDDKETSQTVPHSETVPPPRRATKVPVSKTPTTPRTTSVPKVTQTKNAPSEDTTPAPNTPATDTRVETNGPPTNKPKSNTTPAKNAPRPKESVSGTAPASNNTPVQDSTPLPDTAHVLDTTAVQSNNAPMSNPYTAASNPAQGTVSSFNTGSPHKSPGPVTVGSASSARTPKSRLLTCGVVAVVVFLT